jgi:uncharacterized membrane protein YgcG
MAVTAIHPRSRRGPSSLVRSAALLAAVVVWAAVFGAAYALGSKSTPRPSAQSSTPTLAPGSNVPRSASATVRAPTGPPTISGLRPLAAPPALGSRVVSAAVIRPRLHYVPVYRPAAPAPASSTPTPPTTTTTPPTGGGPHGSGGTGGGTTTVGSGGGSSGGSGGGGVGTTPTTTTPAG